MTIAGPRQATRFNLWSGPARHNTQRQTAHEKKLGEIIRLFQGTKSCQLQALGIANRVSIHGVVVHGRKVAHLGFTKCVHLRSRSTPVLRLIFISLGLGGLHGNPYYMCNELSAGRQVGRRNPTRTKKCLPITSRGTYRLPARCWYSTSPESHRKSTPRLPLYVRHK